MPLYETVLIARNDVTQAQVEQIADDIAAELVTEGGEVVVRLATSPVPVRLVGT